MGKRGRARQRRGDGSPPPLPKGLLQTFATADAVLPELQSGADLREAVGKRRAELGTLGARSSGSCTHRLAP